MKKKQDQPAAADCQQEEFQFAKVKKRTVSAAFTGATVTRDAGVQLLRAADRKLGLLAAVARVWHDRRHPELDRA